MGADNRDNSVVIFPNSTWKRSLWASDSVMFLQVPRDTPHKIMATVCTAHEGLMWPSETTRTPNHALYMIVY